MLSTWTPLRDKENSSAGFQSSKARSVRSSKLDSMPQKKVFGDVGNTMQTLDHKRDKLGNLQTPAKVTGTIPKFDNSSRKIQVWPEPENLPSCASFEDDYEDCWPMHLRISEKGMRNLTNYRGKCKKPMARDIQDSPLPSKLFHEPGEIAFELNIEPVLNDILPPYWD